MIDVFEGSLIKCIAELTIKNQIILLNNSPILCITKVTSQYDETEDTIKLF